MSNPSGVKLSNGSYRGGSSIIKRGGSFGSFDPAESKNTVRAPKKKTAPPSKGIPKPQPPQSLQVQRKSLLDMAANAAVSKKKKKLKFPKNISDEVKRDVARIGSIAEWASKQKGFKALVEGKLERRNTRALRSQADPKPKNRETRSDNSTGQKFRSSNMRRIKKLRSEITEAKDFIRITEKEINRLLRADGQTLDEQ